MTVFDKTVGIEKNLTGNNLTGRISLIPEMSYPKDAFWRAVIFSLS